MWRWSIEHQPPAYSNVCPLSWKIKALHSLCRSNVYQRQAPCYTIIYLCSYSCQLKIIRPSSDLCIHVLQLGDWDISMIYLSVNNGVWDHYSSQLLPLEGLFLSQLRPYSRPLWNSVSWVKDWMHFYPQTSPTPPHASSANPTKSTTH